MLEPFHPTQTDLVLIGGGHAHVTVLKSFAMKPMPGVRLTLITPSLETPYSGMLPGFVAGHYSLDQCHINLLELARFANARWIQVSATGIDRLHKRVLLEGRPPIAYDLLSVNTGITPALAGIQGADEHGIAVKPISAFASRWTALEQRLQAEDGPRHFSVVGGGAAGFELILAMRHRVQQLLPEEQRGECRFSLVTSDGLLPYHNARAQALAQQALQHAGIDLYTHSRVSAISEQQLTFESGETLPMHACLLATRARASAWFTQTGLTLDNEGFLLTRDTLQSVDDDDIFAVGDCAVQKDNPRERAGVFAVRQGPPLADNLRAQLQGKPLRQHQPQTQFLTLLALGDKAAIAARGQWAFQARWAWRWKDWIDRRFMQRFQGNVAKMQRKHPVLLQQMQEIGCNGCAAKVGPHALTQALERLTAQHASPTPAQRDDAVMIEAGDGQHMRVESLDFFRAFCSDPYLLGQVAANHALNDVYAMGGTASHAQALAVVTFGRARIVEEDLFQLLAGAESIFTREGVKLLGGHSSKDTQMAVGFHVSGQVEKSALLKKSGLQTGDALILTRAIGSGVLLAAEMRGRACPAAMSQMLREMIRSNRESAATLRCFGARAMTDVTGFGLLGHLGEMLEASQKSARLIWEAVPKLPTVEALAAEGMQSSLLPENLSYQRLLPPQQALPEAVMSLLCDPQTAGGLLVAVPEAAAEEALAALHTQGEHAACRIGRVQDMALQPSVEFE